jgi:hypothetical protein
MKLKSLIILIAITVYLPSVWAQEPRAAFSCDKKRNTEAKPWTEKQFKNDPAEFQFAIIGDRTGGANVQETFKLALAQLNFLQPEFVINVGDIIEGYTKDKAELHAHWERAHRMGVFWDITREVKKRFDAKGISIPYLQRDVNIHFNDADKRAIFARWPTDHNKMSKASENDSL